MAGYSFPTGVDDGHQVELENGVTYEFRQEFQRWDVVKGTGSSVWITGDLPDENYVSNGDLWFDNTEDTMQLFLWHEDSDAWLPVAPPTTLDARVTAGEATQAAIIAQIQTSLDDQAKIAAKVEELTITKGAVSRYVVKDTAISAVASRNGELYVSSPNAADVTEISFAPFDSNGQTTKPCNADDIIEFVEAVGLRNAGETTRYKVVSGTYNAMTVEYLSGTNDFEIGEAEEVYIYPQNSDLASVEYVDAQDDLLRTMITENGRGLNKKLDKEKSNEVTDGFRIKGDGGTYISTFGDELGLYHVKYPESAGHAATMGYVDDEIAKIVIPEIPEIPEAEEALQPLLWKYMGQQVQAEDLEPGQFTYRYSGDQGAADGWVKIYTSRYDASGRQIASGISFQHDMTDKMFLSMMNEDGGMAIHMKAKILYFNEGSGDNKYHRFEGKFWRVAKSTSTGKSFILNVPGFLPTYGKPSDIASFSLPDEPPCGDIPPEADA